MAISVLDTTFYVQHMQTRTPFRYGIATLTALPHLFVRVEIDVNGMRQTGVAAEGLPPKWFTKNPETTFREDLIHLVGVIKQGCIHAEKIEGDTLYSWWRQVYDMQQAWAEKAGYPPLLWGLGVSLIERSVIDAYCRARQFTFSQLLKSNELGIELGDMYEELHGLKPSELLPAKPLAKVMVRHTVGILDYLNEGDIPLAEQVKDGLPHSLEACIKTYGLTYFKIKLSGNKENDISRLEQIARLFARIGLSDHSFTLDGNEQYYSGASFRIFWEALMQDTRLKAFMKGLLFVEQPVHRDQALSAEGGFGDWQARPLVIIDESDAQIGDLFTALERGYAGTSYKNCKGVFRGIANACLLEKRRRGGSQTPMILSGEDLANMGPVALLQDLTVMASLGIEHVERNGHQIFAGLSMFPGEIQLQTVSQHSDLYQMLRVGEHTEFPALTIQNGEIQIGSLLEAPFGAAVLPDFDSLEFVDFDSAENTIRERY